MQCFLSFNGFVRLSRVKARTNLFDRQDSRVRIGTWLNLFPVPFGFPFVFWRDNQVAAVAYILFADENENQLSTFNLHTHTHTTAPTRPTHK
jgi:hypothetical protein